MTPLLFAVISETLDDLLGGVMSETSKTSIFEDYDNGMEGRNQTRVEIHSHVSSFFLIIFSHGGLYEMYEKKRKKRGKKRLNNIAIQYSSKKILPVRLIPEGRETNKKKPAVIHFSINQGIIPYSVFINTEMLTLLITNERRCLCDPFISRKTH